MIYLDNAATTFRKPKSVIKAARQFYGNPGRGGHRIAEKAGEIIFECREELAKLFTVLDSSRIAFTKNTTEALNIAILGTLATSDHCIISSMEHNSVARAVVASGAEFSIAQANKKGELKVEEIEKHIKGNTKLVCISHVSNVNGAVQNIKEIGKFLRNNEILFLVDAAQSAGVYDISCLDCNIDFLAFPGHKSLYGLSGTGGLYVRDGIEIAPRIFGGTGSMSERLEQPTFMPDSLESGTLNTSGIAALLEGVKFAKSHDLYSHEKYLTKLLIDGLKNIKKIKVYSENSVGVVAFNVRGKDSVTLSNELSLKHGVALRGGYHCAILAHKTLGTDRIGGAARASFGYYNKKSDVDKLLKALTKSI